MILKFYITQNKFKKMKAKTKLKLAKYFFLGGFYFCAAETVLFIILYGWHWNAYNDIESRCDQQAFYLMLIGASFFFSLVINAVELYVKLQSSNK